jgi:hypothetical protein
MTKCDMPTQIRATQVNFNGEADLARSLDRVSKHVRRCAACFVCARRQNDRNIAREGKRTAIMLDGFRGWKQVGKFHLADAARGGTACAFGSSRAIRFAGHVRSLP